jgi:DNA-directed RNA polymerase alpha subunit
MKTSEGFLSTLGAPARRALENEGIKSLKKLSQYTEADILQLHGMGKSSIPKLKEALKSAGLKFKDGK